MGWGAHPQRVADALRLPEGQLVRHARRAADEEDVAAPRLLAALQRHLRRLLDLQHEPRPDGQKHDRHREFARVVPEPGHDAVVVDGGHYPRFPCLPNR